MTPMDSGNQEGGGRQRKSFLAVLCAEDRRESGRREGTMVLRVVARVLAGRQRGLSLRRWCQAASLYQDDADGQRQPRGGWETRKSFLAVLCAEDRRISGRREGTMVLRVVARVLAGRQRGLSLRRWCQAYLIGKAPTKSGALSVFACCRLLRAPDG